MTSQTDNPTTPTPADAIRQSEPTGPDAMRQPKEKEIGGPKETEPTRYGDWTVKGRCIDF